MANYQSTHTGAEIDAGIDLLNNNSATAGQVLTANGTGGASWQNASGGGETQLYRHNIYLYSGGTGYDYKVIFTIINTSSAQITTSTLSNYIPDASGIPIISATGYLYNTSKSTERLPVIGIGKSTSSKTAIIYAFDRTKAPSYPEYYVSVDINLNIIDKVIPIS